MPRLKSYAKINLGLEIVGKRSDGYHNLKTIFQTIDFHDNIEIEENQSGKISLDGDDHAVNWGKSNTIFKAIGIIYKNYHLSRGFDIYVKKRIPAGSGLGGGSSNAAVMLSFLNRHCRLNASLDDLIEMAAAVGADVPFFLVGGTVLGEGIGEKMTLLPDPEKKQLDVVIPPVNVSTRLIFSRFSLTSKPIKSKIDTFIESKNAKILENNLEKVTFELFPEVGVIKDKMNMSGYELVMMSGSGSAVYGLYDSADGGDVTALSSLTAEQRLSRLKENFPGARVLATRMIDRQNYLKGIGASPSGKASVFGADTRRFESSRPSKYTENVRK